MPIRETSEDVGSAEVSRARRAVSAVFFANGLATGHWATQIPVLVARLDISQTRFGQMIILFGVGAVAALIAGAALVGRFGSDTMMRITLLMLAPALIFISLAPSVWMAALTMLWLGIAVAIMDNAMNANGVEVETALKRPVMSSYHGFWSVGAALGGLTGGYLIVAFGELGHGVYLCLAILILTGVVWRSLLPGARRAAPSGAPAETETRGGLLVSVQRAPGILLLGVVALLGYAPEGTVIDWSALYLSRERGAPPFAEGYAVAAFSLTMAGMRLAGDRLRARFGDRKLFVISALIAALGLALASLATSVLLVCAGFLVAGLGMANMVPITFSAAGRYPGLTPATGIAVAAAFGYSGLLFVPALIGLVADAYSLAAVFTGWATILLALALAAVWGLSAYRVSARDP